MRFQLLVVPAGIILAAISLGTRPAHAQWQGVPGYTLVSRTPVASGPGAFHVSETGHNNVKVWVHQDATTNNQISSSIEVTKVVRKNYTWQGATPTSGNFKVSASGTTSGTAAISPSYWLADAGSFGEVTFPPSGGVSRSWGECYDYTNNTTSPKSFAKTPAGNINADVGSLLLTAAYVEFTVRAKASGSIGTYAHMNYATYAAEANTTYNVGPVVP